MSRKSAYDDYSNSEGVNCGYIPLYTEDTVNADRPFDAKKSARYIKDTTHSSREATVLRAILQSNLFRLLASSASVL